MAVMMAMPVPPVPAMMMVPPAPVTAVMPAAPAMMVTPTPVMMMPVPAHFGGRLLLGILLHRRRSARIDQRHCLRALDRSRDHKQCAGGCKTQGSHSLHSHSSSPTIHASAVWLPSTRQQPAATRESNLAEGDVNDD